MTTSKRIFYILIISIVVSLLTTVLLQISESKEYFLHELTNSDKFMEMFFMVTFLYFFVVIIGTLISFTVRFFTRNSLIIFVTYLLVGLLIYWISPWEWANGEGNYVFIISAAIFGILDIRFLKYHKA
ncbi:hypothetical protein BK126_18470 [Paenibacillus sp. FSL H7-0326]|uniref:hypothetical protein n=1 Tax=Paenibacillus sp. FSL H7-0326 TaxID=1921144 RepID=UPI00096C2B6F|nr:hypothetical protein [Paenibacillus sp. FSL H7-0326]OMC67557.1 hypothetical protein BK126_18470 [Paenibacillus sp. FSL H7-0326]